MIPIQYLGAPQSDWRNLVSSCPDAEFTTGTRSTLPLLEFWRDPQRALDEMRRHLGVPLDNASLMFEHQTPVQDGRGKASHTDLMLGAQAEAAAIEGKYNEPAYESVAEWSGTEPTDNRTSVLKGWLGLISAKSGVELNAEMVSALPYQLIHRTASACAMNRQQALVVYHLFGTGHRDYYHASLRFLAQLCRSDTIRFFVLETPATQIPAFSALLNRLDGNPNRASLIREAMLNEPAYSFGETKAEQLK